jgi:fatty acid desaturase/outer membrane lipoprotein-sorting protein
MPPGRAEAWPVRGLTGGREESPHVDRVPRLLDLLNDRRDRPLVRVILSASVVIPAALYLYLPGRFDWRVALAYWLVWGFLFLDRVTLMLHCTSHRTLFSRRVHWLNLYVPWILAPFYGQTPTTYFAHHIAMHHVEDNLPEDLSSTMRYRRDRFLDWLHYLGRFLLLNVVLLPAYLYRKGRRGLAWRAVVGELAFWTAGAGLAVLNLEATMVVFLVPVLVIRALMMAGNWGQHAFIDPGDPANPYGNSITCINCRYNRRCFNDGYHIVHHLRPTQHWMELPAEFEARREVYGKHDAVVFDGIDFFTVWLYLMLHRWNALARAFVRLPGAPARSDDQVVSFLKERLQPIGRTHASRARDRRWTAVAVVAVVLASGTAWAESAVEIMQKQRAMHRVKDEEETLVMRLVSKTGAVKERRLVRYTLTGPDTLSKILIRFLAPRSLENTGLLTWEAPNGDDDQWLYLPATKKVKRVAASGKSQRFMGTDFAYEDMQLESVRRHKYQLLGSESIDGQDGHVIEAVPATERQAADSGYSKRKLWVRKDNYFTVKREYYDRKGKLEKVGTERKLVQVSGTVWRATELQMHDLEAGTRTILVVEHRAVDKGLKESLLTETGLTQGGP